MAGIQFFGKPDAVLTEDMLVVLLADFVEQRVVMSRDKQLGFGMCFEIIKQNKFD